MKRIFITLIILTIMTVPVGYIFSQDAQDIVDRADAAFTGERVYSKSTMTIYRNGRARPVQEMESYTMDSNGEFHSLTVYQSPARMRGTAYLMIGDDLWVRFSTTGRVRKMSSSAKKNSAGGSDLSYADMGDGNQGIADKYDAELTDDASIDGTDCYRIELTPGSGEDLPYEKVVAYITKDNYRYIKLEYYEAGANIKTMTLGDYREVGNRCYPFHMEMKSLVKDSRTVIETTLMEFDSPKVRRRLFSTAHLESLR